MTEARFSLLHRVEFIDSVIILCPLKIRPDFSNKRSAVAFGNLQLFSFSYTIFLSREKVKLGKGYNKWR